MKRKFAKYSLFLLACVFSNALLFGCGGGGGGGGSSDTTKPAITTFTVPTTSTSLTISGITLVATDNVGVTGYLINESATPPSAASVNLVNPPTTYTAATFGAKTLYAWARDAAGNVSAVFTGRPCTFDDGKAYLYATDPSVVIDIVPDGTNATIDVWGSGATLNGEYAGDTTYGRVFSVVSGTGWGTNNAALAFTGLAANFYNAYKTLHFKFKSADMDGIRLKFDGAAVPEIVYNRSMATSLGNGWYEFAIPLTNHGSLASSSAFAFLNNKTTGPFTFYLTDIYFDATVTPGPTLALDDDGDARVYLYPGNSFSRQEDLTFGVNYTNFSDWGSGTPFTTVAMAPYEKVLSMPSGTNWGNAACVAFYGFSPGFFSNYTNINFTFKSDLITAVAIKFPGALGTEEVSYAVTPPALSTYTVTDLGGGFYKFSIPIADYHGAVTTSTEFGIIGGDDFYVTDINFN